MFLACELWGASLDLTFHIDIQKSGSELLIPSLSSLVNASSQLGSIDMKVIKQGKTVAKHKTLHTYNPQKAKDCRKNQLKGWRSPALPMRWHPRAHLLPPGCCWARCILMEKRRKKVGA